MKKQILNTSLVRNIINSENLDLSNDHLKSNITAKTKKRINYLNYSNKGYNILNLKQIDDPYYQKFANCINKYHEIKYLGLKSFKVNKSHLPNNFIVKNFKMAKNYKKKKQLNKSQVEQPNKENIKCSLPLLFTKKKEHPSLPKFEEITKRSMSSHMGSKTMKSLMESKTVDPIQRVESLFNYINKLTDKKKAIEYALIFINKCKCPELTRHIMRETFLSLIENQKKSEEDLNDKLDEQPKATQIVSTAPNKIDNDGSNCQEAIKKEENEEKKPLEEQKLNVDNSTKVIELENKIKEMYLELCKLKKENENKQLK